MSQTTIPAIYDAQGRSLAIDTLLGRGGEGAVYSITGNPSVVAKVYHEVPGQGKAAKIQAMANAAKPDLLAIAAWPTGTLYTRPGGPVVGLIMPKVHGHKEIHHLYSPAQRKVDFPKADWEFLVTAALNVANAFATIHSHGHVIGDVNQGNVVVAANATVKLIDCDSFQIAADRHRFLCEVGVAHFTPPELQGGSFRGILRTADHDRFGLALIIFHLLFMGRHPFAGIFSGRGDMPLEKAIKEGRFAFGRSAVSFQMKPPPKALSLAQVSTRVADLFEQAFRLSTGGQVARPSAVDWINALKTLRSDLRQCANHPGHKYATAARACPWCAIEQSGGPDFFISIAVASLANSNFDLDRIWQEIQSAAPPPAAIPTGLANPQPAGAGTLLPARIQNLHTFGQATAVLAGLLVVVSLFGPGFLVIVAMLLLGVRFLVDHEGGYTDEYKAREGALAAAKQAHAQALSRWQSSIEPSAKLFTTRRDALSQAREKYRALPATYQQERDKLAASARERQLHRFLDSYFIEHASIPGIGAGRKDVLVSFGVETAADLTLSNLVSIPGFGEKLINVLLAWRTGIERRFSFDPRAGIDPADITVLNRRYARIRQDLEQVLAGGGAELKRISSQAEGYRAVIQPELLKTASAVASAGADMNVVTGSHASGLQKKLPRWYAPTLIVASALIAVVKIPDQSNDSAESVAVMQMDSAPATLALPESSLVLSQPSSEAQLPAQENVEQQEAEPAAPGPTGNSSPTEVRATTTEIGPSNPSPTAAGMQLASKLSEAAERSFNDGKYLAADGELQRAIEVIVPDDDASVALRLELNARRLQYRQACETEARVAQERGEPGPSCPF